MVYLSKPAYVIENAEGWSAKYREHPVFDWMADFSHAFDFGDMKASGPTPWLADDIVFTHPSGKVFTGVKASWEGILEMYSMAASHYHEPVKGIIWETDKGYKLMGFVKLYINLPVPGEKKCKDLSGREWDTMGNGAAAFEFVKDASGPKGLKMTSHTLIADPLGIQSEMIARKMCTADDIFAMHKKLTTEE
jgi:hypothetical protein